VLRVPGTRVQERPYVSFNKDVMTMTTDTHQQNRSLIFILFSPSSTAGIDVFVKFSFESSSHLAVYSRLSLLVSSIHHAMQSLIIGNIGHSLHGVCRAASLSPTSDVIINGGSGSLWLQGLQTGRRWGSSRKADYRDFRRKGCGHGSEQVRLPGRVRIRSQHRSGWQVDKPRQGTRRYIGSSWYSRVNSPCFLFLMCVCMVGLAHGFQGEYLSIVCRRSMLTFLCNKSDSSCFDEEFLEGAGEDGELIPDLQWRLAKAKLEEAHTKSFLRSKPRHLAYDECRKWVMAWHRWDSEEDWREWINMGEKRNAYIPALPDEYYGALGQWISWDHFLGRVGNGNTEDLEHKIGEFD